MNLKWCITHCDHRRRWCTGNKLHIIFILYMQTIRSLAYTYGIGYNIIFIKIIYLAMVMVARTPSYQHRWWLKMPFRWPTHSTFLICTFNSLLFFHVLSWEKSEQYVACASNWKKQQTTQPFLGAASSFSFSLPRYCSLYNCMRNNDDPFFLLQAIHLINTSLRMYIYIRSVSVDSYYSYY